MQKFAGKSWVGALAALAMLSMILVANWVTTDYGFIPVGFGFEATAGTLFVGFSLAARDLLQDTWGKLAVLAVIILGTLMSWIYAAPAIALASAAAYGLAELLDFAVYTPLRARATFGDRKWAGAVVVSNIVGAVVDSVVFLGIAFGAAAIAPALPGQIVGKMWATIAYLAVGAAIAWWWRKARGKHGRGSKRRAEARSA